MQVGLLSFSVNGIVTKREIKTGKNDDGSQWQSQVLEITYLGGTQRLKVTDEQYDALELGQTYKFEGRIVRSGTYTNFELDTLVPAKGKQTAA